MNFSSLSLLLLFFLLVLSHVKSADWDNVPFEQNYISLWGQQNMQILDQSREVQLMLDKNSGKTYIVHLYIHKFYLLEKVKIVTKTQRRKIYLFSLEC
jgi:hypothetical protein